MLRQVKELNGYKLGARDGEIGHARELYFEDVNWTVRYLVADTSNWLMGRRVLISPYALDPIREAEKIIPVELTKQQIETAPALETERPVSRQYELDYYSFYGWPAYWDGTEVWGNMSSPNRARVDGPTPVVNRQTTRTCAALEMLSAIQSRLWTARSATLRTSWWMTKPG